jgi:hypothetical protein
MVAFMDTVATIPTGAMAERWKWKAFVGWGLFCGAIFYPLFGAWTWGGGWLAKTWDTMGLGAGYVDFAGSGVVHAVGGIAGLAGAMVLGPRIGKYNEDGSANTLPGHHIPMAMLGCFILLCGDKVVRPVVARDGVRLRFVWVLMGCLGGFEVLGLIGLVIGPVVLTLARELWEQRVRDLAVADVTDSNSQVGQVA